MNLGNRHWLARSVILAGLGVLFSCSSEVRKASTPAEPAKVEVATPTVPMPVLPPAIAGHPATEHTAAPAEVKHSSPAPTPSAAHHVEGIAPETSLGWLKNGNVRFTKKHFRSDGRSPEDRARLTKGQKPHAIILSCSDSRVPPEHVFDQGLGEIFVIRVAGEVLDYGVIGSIEYAAEHLGSRLIVVLGHEACGAVKAAIGTPEGQSAGSPDLDKLVADIRPRISKVTRVPLVGDVLVESGANAKGIAKDLLARSPLLSGKVNTGELKIVSAIYHLGSGYVEFFRD